MAVRFEPNDEYQHEPTDEAGFNESMYANLVDPGSGLGAFFRIGNRVNEGRAEVTACVYLPDGRVAFTYLRPEISTNERLDAGGMQFEVVRPVEHIAVRYEGRLTVLTDPLEMNDPRAAFTSNPAVRASVAVDFHALAPIVGGEGEGEQAEGDDFAKAHYEQLVRSSGSVTVGDESFAVEGFGLRDHSWGKRSWQAPWFYRWLTGAGPDGFGFMATHIGRREGPPTLGGFVWDDGELHLCRECEIGTEWSEEGALHEKVTATLRSGDRAWTVVGDVTNLIPLRNRRDGQVTRITEGLTTWHDEGGRVAYGLSEYLDQIVDGLPVGMAEEVA